MSLYRNQAQRVMDYIVQDSKLPEETVSKTLNITVDKLELQIQVLASNGFGNGKKCADLLIDQWNRANPDYIQNNYKVMHVFGGRLYRFKVLENEFHIFFNTPHGDYLHNIQSKYVDTDEFRNQSCETAWNAYLEKAKNL